MPTLSILQVNPALQEIAKLISRSSPEWSYEVALLPFSSIDVIDVKTCDEKHPLIRFATRKGILSVHLLSPLSGIGKEGFAIPFSVAKHNIVHPATAAYRFACGIMFALENLS